MWYQTKGVRSSGLMGNEWESVELNSQLTNMNQPEFDPHLNYESLFDQCMRLLEEYHETPLDPLQLQQTYANVWLSLRGLKAKWQLEQRHASLALPTTSMNTTKSPLSQRDIYDLREKFQRFYSYLLRFSDAGSAQQMLIKDSMIIEWPTSVDSHDSDQSNDYGQPNPILVDRAPLLFISHSDKSTRVRRKYPTVQLRILALNQKTAPAAVQCRARIVRESVNRMEVEKYGKWQPAGKLIKVIKDGQKEHPNLSYEEDNEGLVANCGQLLTSPLQFDNSSTLVVQFSEISIDASDRRADSSLVRYRVEMHCRLMFANGVEIENTVLSNPFLIAASDEPNTAVLGDMAWEIMTTTAVNPPVPPHLQRVCWGDLRNFLRHSVQWQLPQARALDDEELLHLQCMLFLPLAVDHRDLNELESYFFGPGNERNNIDKIGIKKIKYRLLREFVCDYVEIDANHFLKEKCISMKDGQTALKHSVWEWLSDAIEMIVDRDPAHLICKDSNPQTKKRNKSSMMLKLFNDKLITMSGRDRVWKVYKSLCLYDQKNERPPTKAILIHFCDKLAGHLTLHYSNIKTDEKPTYGDVSAACLRAYDGGLAVMLMQATWPSKFDRLVKFNSEEQVQIKYGKERASFPKKKHIFVGFEPKATMRPHPVDPLQHDPALGPVHLPSTSSPPFVLTLSTLPNSTHNKHITRNQNSSKIPHRAVTNATNTQIIVSTETKDRTRIKHSIDIEHFSKVCNDFSSTLPVVK